MLLHVRPVNCSANWYVKGETPECMVVTLLSGSRDCTIRNNFPPFLSMQNHLDRYEELDGLKMPASIFCLNSLQSLSYIPGGIWIFLSIHGLWGMTGMSISGKKSSWKCSLLELSQSNASLCNIMKLCSRVRLSGRRKWLLSLSNCSFLSWVYLPVGVKETGCGFKTGRLASGSPLMFQMILNLAGRSSRTGLTVHATGLYFFSQILALVPL